MKQLKRIFMFVAVLLVLFTATACSKKGVKNISCEFDVTARRDKITVVAEFIDDEERVFNTITPTVSIYNYENGKVGEVINSKSLSIKSGTSFSEKTTSNEAVFSGLKEKSWYTVKVLVTVDGYETVLAEKNVETTLEGSDAENPILIKTIEDFLAIKNDREGFFKLENDLTFDEKSNMNAMFYTQSTPFTGEFDGNGHTIKNVNIISDYKYTGLFGLNTGTIKNLNLENVTIKSKASPEAHVGALVGYNEGVIDNCKVKNVKMEVEARTHSNTNPFNVGVLAGTVSGTVEGIKVINCNVENATMDVKLVNSGTVGGAFGSIEGTDSARNTQEIKNNNIDVKINVEQALKTGINDNIDFLIGGFAGQVVGNMTDINVNATIKVKTASNDNHYFVVEENKKPKNLEFNLYVGGFAGRNIPNKPFKLTNVKFNGSVDVNSELKYTESTNKDVVKHLIFNMSVGGFMGELSKGTLRNVTTTVTTLNVAASKTFINGEHTLNVGKLLGKTLLTKEDLAGKISLTQDFTETIKNDDNFKLNLNDIK